VEFVIHGLFSEMQLCLSVQRRWVCTFDTNELQDEDKDKGRERHRNKKLRSLLFLHCDIDFCVRRAFIL
jgi:hypothetical protein